MNAFTPEDTLKPHMKYENLDTEVRKPSHTMRNLTTDHIFLLPSSFFLLPSSFFLLHSSFFILHSSFFLHAGGRVAPGRVTLLRPSVPDTVQQWNDVRFARAHRRRASPDPNRGGEGAAGTVRSNEETRERRGRDDRGIGRDEGARTPPPCVVRVSAV